MDECLKSFQTWLNIWFEKIIPWDCHAVSHDRFVWLRIEGVPLHLWSVKLFSEIGRLWGSFVTTDESTHEEQRFDVARILISIPYNTVIPSSISFKANGEFFSIQIVEEPVYNFPNFCSDFSVQKKGAKAGNFESTCSSPISASPCTPASNNTELLALETSGTLNFAITTSAQLDEGDKIIVPRSEAIQLVDSSVSTSSTSKDIFDAASNDNLAGIETSYNEVEGGPLPLVNYNPTEVEVGDLISSPRNNFGFSLEGLNLVVDLSQVEFEKVSVWPVNSNLLEQDGFLRKTMNFSGVIGLSQNAELGQEAGLNPKVAEVVNKK
ncbi:hypothetical protein REPUB_Repub01dG0247300 [Reevesia pubescens]